MSSSNQWGPEFNSRENHYFAGVLGSTMNGTGQLCNQWRPNVVSSTSNNFNFAQSNEINRSMEPFFSPVYQDFTGVCGSSVDTWQLPNQWGSNIASPTLNHFNVMRSNANNYPMVPTDKNSGQPVYQNKPSVYGSTLDTWQILNQCGANVTSPTLNHFNVMRSNANNYPMDPTDKNSGKPVYQNKPSVYGSTVDDTWQIPYKWGANVASPTFNHFNVMRSNANNYLVDPTDKNSGQPVYQNIPSVHGSRVDSWQSPNQWGPNFVSSTPNHYESVQSCEVNRTLDQFDNNNGQLYSHVYQNIPSVDERAKKGVQETPSSHLVNYLNFLYEPMSPDRVNEQEKNEQSEGTMHEEHQNEQLIEVESIDPVDDEAVPILNELPPIECTKTEQLVTTPKFKLGCDNSKMFVKTSNGKSKKLCCPFCNKLQSKLAQHMEDMHKTEPDVKKFLSFPKRSSERRRIQDALRKIGTLNWNKNAELNEGQLITSRCPNEKFNKTGVDFKTCPYCSGSYAKTALRLHVSYKCPNKPISNNKESEVERITTALGTSLEARIHENATERLKEVFKRFRDDSLVRLIRFDWLLIVYGNRLCMKYKRPKHAKMIRNRLRLAGRILIAVKDVEPEVTEFVKLYQPEYFDALMTAIENLARLDNDSNEFEAPTSASDAGTAVKQIGNILISEYIRRRDRESKIITKEFLDLMDIDFPTMISKTVAETKARMKREKQVELPSPGDIKLLSEHIESERQKCFSELSVSFSYKKWKQLSEFTMAAIIVFNRRRVGDVENIVVGDFMRREIINENSTEQLYQNLSDEGKQLVKQYSRMTVLGKKGSTVPVLLKSELEKSITLLLHHRQDACITSNNKELFALPSSLVQGKVINGYTTLKRIASACGAKKPELLTGTLLRKQFATGCVLLELNDNDVAEVAKFMGHAEAVHRKFYRQNPLECQIVKMSQLLEAAQGNDSSSISDFSQLKKLSQLLEAADLSDLRLIANSNPMKKLLQLLEAEESNDIPLIADSNQMNSNQKTVAVVRNRKRPASSDYGLKKKSRGTKR